MVKPLCFMIMPFGRKPTQAEAGKGPAEIDFNALWDRAYVPVVEALGYDAVRADQDAGALIVKEMLERLYFADLVLADMTIPNGNVYYEVGIRHAAKKTGCVLLAADWSRQLFDVTQLRTAGYPLPEGEILPETARAIAETITQKIENLRDGESPMHQSITGYPSNVDMRAGTAMKDQMAALAAFQAEVRAVRAAPKPERMRRAQELVAKHGAPPLTAPVAVALLLLLRDCVDSKDDWTIVLAFIKTLPKALLTTPEIQEHRAFAMAHSGEAPEAIGALETLIEQIGPTPERLGLLGGRYKNLAKNAQSPAECWRHLNNAIESYERGMQLDLNEYYCVSNLARLYRQRGDEGDEERAQTSITLTLAACRRAENRKSMDEWWRPTLLGAAFDQGDLEKARRLARQVAAEGAARWKVESTLRDLDASISQTRDPDRRAGLTDIIASLKTLTFPEDGSLSSAV